MTLQILKKIWICFLKIDKEGKGFILPYQVLAFIEEQPYSVSAPFFIRFFDIIDKDDPDHATFTEFLPALVTYCLFSRDEIFGFVFSLLDEDKNDDISKQDIFKFLMQFREGFRVFPPNLTRAVEIVKIMRGDQINIV